MCCFLTPFLYGLSWQGKLIDGTVFDSSFERGDPIEFELGSGQVIKGLWNLMVNYYVCKCSATSFKHKTK